MRSKKSKVVFSVRNWSIVLDPEWVDRNCQSIGFELNFVKAKCLMQVTLHAHGPTSKRRLARFAPTWTLFPDIKLLFFFFFFSFCWASWLTSFFLSKVLFLVYGFSFHSNFYTLLGMLHY